MIVYSWRTYFKDVRNYVHRITKVGNEKGKIKGTSAQYSYAKQKLIKLKYTLTHISIFKINCMFFERKSSSVDGL